MARKATDLLDVFRYGEGDDGEGRAAGGRTASKARPSKGSRRAARKRAGFDGMILTRRQVILGASVCCLLVALSFVLGLSAGSPGGDTPAASRTTPAGAGIIVRGQLPAMDPASQRPIET